MKELLDYDIDTGVAYYTETDDETLITTVETVQDCQPLLDRNAELRATGAWDKDAPGGGGWRKAYDLPDTIILELMKKGINMMRPTEDDFRRCDREIETNYPYLKASDKKVWRV